MITGTDLNPAVRLILLNICFTTFSSQYFDVDDMYKGMKSLSSFTHIHVVPNLRDLLSSLKHKGDVLKNVSVFVLPYEKLVHVSILKKNSIYYGNRIYRCISIN